MTKQELADASRKAMAEYRKLPDHVQWSHMMERGVINHEGTVLMGKDSKDQVDFVNDLKSKGLWKFNSVEELLNLFRGQK